MTQKRLTLCKIREIQPLNEELGLSNRVIARACKVSNNAVGDYLERAKQAGLGWVLPEGLSEDYLYKRLFPENGDNATQSARPVSDWEEMPLELSRRWVTLKLLWIEPGAASGWIRINPIL